MSADANQETIIRAAHAIRDARALLVGAGAGMGVDSGLPDFRGDEGFWRSYPPFRKEGLAFEDMANPRWFRRDPKRAWGFYGHRRNLYRNTEPHEGFAILRRLGEAMANGYHVFTSNVDGQFQRAGFAEDRIVECHGTIEYEQCAVMCSDDIWPAKDTELAVDEANIRARAPLPTCPRCGGVARPNVLMFGDFGWQQERTERQEKTYRAWVRELGDEPLVVIECGAGTEIATVRYECERHRKGQLIRINPRESDAPRGAISLPMGALEALTRIDSALANL